MLKLLLLFFSGIADHKTWNVRDLQDYWALKVQCSINITNERHSPDFFRRRKFARWADGIRSSYERIPTFSHERYPGDFFVIALTIRVC